MNRTKTVYFILMFISVFLVSTMCFSYAFFTSKTEGSGKLNIVAGTLDYKLESEDLENNKVTLNAGEIKEITISLKSLNEIDSKYELYYSLNKENNNIRIGYDKDTKDNISGIINANSTKKITIVARNESDENVEVTFNAIGGLSNNELVLKEGKSLNQTVGKYKVYSIGDEITLIDGSKWHVLENTDEYTETVVLLSDYNLNSDGSYNDECGRDINSTYACSTMAFDFDNTNTYDETDSNNIGYFIKNIYTPLVIKSLPGTTKVTLPTAYQLAAADNQSFNQSELELSNGSWLLTTNYWTKNSHEGYLDKIWIVSGGGAYLSGSVYRNVYSGLSNESTTWGARPTITTSKSNIVDTLSSTSELSIGTAVEAVDGSKWHVLEASNSDSKYVTLLSDYNLNSDGTYNTECGKDINNTYYCSTTAFDPDNTNKYDEIDSNNIGYFIKNTYVPLVTKKLLETTKVTLPKADQIATADNQSFNQTGLVLTKLWLATTNYWTQTSVTANTYAAWTIYGFESKLNDTHANNPVYAGARPVITTLKTNLKSK